jgi:excisionase family DNA binding protein
MTFHNYPGETRPIEGVHDMPTTDAESTPLLLTVEQGARRLGIGRTTFYALVMSGEIESVPIGKLRRIPAECLDEYVQRLRQMTRTTTNAA